jgi:glycosyltransferase involved in cell wall biosynthesis
MNIAVNTRLLIKDKLEGIGWFSYQTLKRITQQHPEHHFYFIFDRDFDKEFIFSSNVTPIVAGIPTRHPILWWLWFDITIPRVLKKIKADLFLSTDGYLSLKTKIPQIAVIHDLNFAHHPEYLPTIISKYYNYFFPRFAKKAKRLGTVSEYSKQDIVSTYSIDASIIDVCYNGITEAYRPISESEKQLTREKYTQANEYFIFVGALNPRKNIVGLLKSYDAYCEAGGTHSLLIVGDAMHKTEEISQTVEHMRHKHKVLFVGRLNIEELSKAMAAACAMVFVPFFEGFGIPLVEAMRCEIPIICSNTTSLPEVAGNAALYASPTDVPQIAQHMMDVSTDIALRKQLIDAGRIQQQKFSWDLSASRLWACIEKVIL